MKVLIMIPAYNEETAIEKVVDNIINNYPQFDYVIVNDCSTDNTEKICKKHNYNYVSLCTNLGIGGGVQTAYQYAVMHEYDYTVQIDGDGQHDPCYIQKMIDMAIKQNYDMVIGSRFLNKQGFQSSFFRRCGITWINDIIFICCGQRVTDATSGLRVASRELTNFFASNYAQDYPEPEAIVNACLNGYSISEYPVIMNERIGGKSSINFTRSIYYMIKVTMALILLRFSTKRIK